MPKTRPMLLGAETLAITGGVSLPAVFLNASIQQFLWRNTHGLRTQRSFVPSLPRMFVLRIALVHQCAALPHSREAISYCGSDHGSCLVVRLR